MVRIKVFSWPVTRLLIPGDQFTREGVERGVDRRDYKFYGVPGRTEQLLRGKSRLHRKTRIIQPRFIVRAS